MSQYNVRIDFRRLERLVCVIIVILLFLMIIKTDFRNNALKYFENREGITGAVTGIKEPEAAQPAPAQNTTQNIGPDLKMPQQTQPVAQTKPNCQDRIKNQDETGVDCGGVCGGFWYDSRCNAAPKRPIIKECEIDDDCREGYLCELEKCILNPYSGVVTMQISNIKFATIEREDEDPLGQLTALDVYIKNDRASPIRSPRLEIYIWDNLTADSYEFDIRQASIALSEVPEGGILQQAITTQEPYYLVALPFRNINITKHLRAELYDYKNNITANISMTFI